MISNDYDGLDNPIRVEFHGVFHQILLTEKNYNFLTKPFIIDRFLLLENVKRIIKETKPDFKINDIS